MGARRITVSTVGLVPQIRRLARENLALGLAISLHATTDDARSQIVPINQRYPLDSLVEAARGFAEQVGRRVTIEYTLLAGVNDSRSDATRLAEIARRIPSKVNLIPYNPVPGMSWKRPHEGAVERFAAWLAPRAPAVTVRWSQGVDIGAACGQLGSAPPRPDPLNLRRQLTVALLVLGLVPSVVVSAVALRQVIEINQLWQSAGMEDALTSSVSVARESVDRLETDLEYAADPIVMRWSDRPPDLERDPPERLFVARYLRDLGFHFLHVYTPDGRGGFRLESAVAPESVVVGRTVDLAPEIAAMTPADPSLRSETGALAYVHEIAGGRRVAIGYLLAPDFFLRLNELQLGLGIIRALGVYARVFRTWLLALLAVILIGVAGLAVVAATWLSRRLAGPVSELSCASSAWARPGCSRFPCQRTPRPRSERSRAR